MTEMKSIDEIRSELRDIDFSKAEAPAQVADGEQAQDPRTSEIIKDVHSQAIVEIVRNDKDVQEQILSQARDDVKVGMQSLHQEGVKKLQDTTYDANKEACECFGIEQAVPLWQIRIMRVLHDIWFIIYLVFAFVTICPVNVFCRGIKRFIKTNWVVVLIGILIYIAILLIPFLVPYIGNLLKDIEY